MSEPPAGWCAPRKLNGSLRSRGSPFSTRWRTVVTVLWTDRCQLHTEQVLYCVKVETTTVANAKVETTWLLRPFCVESPSNPSNRPCTKFRLKKLKLPSTKIWSLGCTSVSGWEALPKSQHWTFFFCRPWPVHMCQESLLWTGAHAWSVCRSQAKAIRWFRIWG